MKKSQIAKQQRYEQLEHDIAEATRPLFLREGYDSLTIRDICANAGITTGMFYRHFVSKDDVLSYCYMLEIRDVIAAVDDELAGLTLPEQIVRLIVNIFQVYRQYGASAVYIFLNRNTVSTSGSFKMRFMIRDKVVELIDAAVANGYQLRTERSGEEIFNDISTIMKGLSSDWYMTGQDIILRTEDLLGRLVPVLL